MNELSANNLNPNDSIALWYEKYYGLVNLGGQNAKFANQIIHRTLESRYSDNSNLRILEVGINEGEHIPYVSETWENGGKYVGIDLRKPPNQILKYFSKKNIQFSKQNVENLSFKSNYFDRVIVTCVLHHTNNPVNAMQEIRRVTKVGGTIDILLPNDPGFMYRTLAFFSSGIKAKKLKVFPLYKIVKALEHKNHYLSLISLLKSVFCNDYLKFTFFPLKIKSYSLNIFTFIHVIKK